MLSAIPVARKSSKRRAPSGLIVDRVDWRWVFYVNLPIAFVAWLAGRRLLREARDESAPGWPDAIGVVLITLAVGALSLAIVEGTDWGWTDPRIVGAFVLVAILVPAVVLRAARHPAPVLDLASGIARCWCPARSSSPWGSRCT